MSEARVDHTTTVLCDGTVLVLGGLHRVNGTLRAVASAERFNPRTGHWTQALTLAIARFGHAIVMTDPDHVVVVGGRDDEGVELGAETCDLRSKACTITSSMNDGRYGAAAALIDGRRVLVAAGVRSAKMHSVEPVKSSEVYDAERGSWTNLGSANGDEGLSLTALPNGNAVLLGAGSSVTDYRNSAGIELRATANHTSDIPIQPQPSWWTFDLATMSWQTLKMLPLLRHHHTATLVQDGRIVVIGGRRDLLAGGSSILDDVILVSPSRALARTVGRLAAPRVNHTATRLPSGDILVVGGYTKLLGAEGTPQPIATSELVRLR